MGGTLQLPGASEPGGLLCIDLSVGANLALATVMGGLVSRVVDSAPLVMLAMLAAGARTALCVDGSAPALALAEAATRSAKSGQPVRLADV